MAEIGTRDRAVGFAELDSWVGSRWDGFEDGIQRISRDIQEASGCTAYGVGSSIRRFLGGCLRQTGCLWNETRRLPARERSVTWMVFLQHLSDLLSSYVLYVRARKVYPEVQPRSAARSADIATATPDR